MLSYVDDDTRWIAITAVLHVNNNNNNNYFRRYGCANDAADENIIIVFLSKRSR